MPPHRTRNARSLEVNIADAQEVSAAPSFTICSPTPRASSFSFTSNATHRLSLCTADPPLELDLEASTLSPSPVPFSSPASSLLQSPSEASVPDTFASESSIAASSASASSSPVRPSTRRRRSTAADIHERRPKKGDEDYIKRPENAFILFRRKCVQERNDARDAAGIDAESGATVPRRQRQADLSKAISAQWKALSADEKQYWESLAKEKKEEHAKLHPDYVYRPVRVKKSKAAAAAATATEADEPSPSNKGKGKSPSLPPTADDASTGTIPFLVPVYAAEMRGGRPVGPISEEPAFHQQIHIPTMPHLSISPLPQPNSPTEVASIAGRRTSKASDVEMDDWSSPIIEPFVKPEGWHPDPIIVGSGFGDFYYPPHESIIPPEPGTSFPGDESSISFSNALYSLSEGSDIQCFPPAVFEKIPGATSSPISTSPYRNLFSSTSGEVEPVLLPPGEDMWQSMSLDMSTPARNTQTTFVYSNNFAGNGMWAAPIMQQSDFDIDQIPAATAYIGMPKFEGCAGADQCPPPAALDVSLYDDGSSKAKVVVIPPESDLQHHQQPRDTFMQTFNFDAAIGLASRADY